MRGKRVKESNEVWSKKKRKRKQIFVWITNYSGKSILDLLKSKMDLIQTVIYFSASLGWFLSMWFKVNLKTLGLVLFFFVVFSFVFYLFLIVWFTSFWSKTLLILNQIFQWQPKIKFTKVVAIIILISMIRCLSQDKMTYDWDILFLKQSFVSWTCKTLVHQTNYSQINDIL